MPCDFAAFHNASSQAETKVNENNKCHYWPSHFLHQPAELAYASQCSFSLVWRCPNFHPLSLFKMASICKLLLSPCFFWFVSQQNLFMKSVQLLIVVLSYCFFSHTCLYKKWLQSQNATKIFFNIRFFFNHYVSSHLSHFVHFFHFLYSWSL